MADTDQNDDTSTDESSTDTTETDDTGPSGEDQLGDAGKKALDAERKARRDAESARRKLEAELDELRQQGLSEQEKAVEEAKKAGAAEASARYASLIVAAEIKAAAASKVAAEAIEDLPRLLDLDPTELVGDDGTVDTDAISSAIDEAVKARPYLAPAATKGTPDPDQGARSGGRPTQLTRDALKNMTPDEISQARREGRLDDLMAGRG